MQTTADERKARKRETNRAWREANKEHRQNYMRDYRAKNKDKLSAYYFNKKEWMRDYNREKKYGLTAEAWDALFEAQGRSCAVCQSTDPRAKRGWHVDHCHETGAVRGILCAGCNTGLGHFRDDIDALSKAIAYLKRYK